jgi:hypothetical protein
MESPEVRTLVVAELYPWPPVDGYRQRLHHIVGGLSQAGPLDVFAPLRDRGTEPVAPPWPGVERTLTVPMGDIMGLPVGLAFMGRAGSEADLLAMAFAFEQATHARTAPTFMPTLGK